MHRRAFVAAIATVAVAGCVDLTTGGSSDFEEGNIGMSAHSFLPEEYHTEVGETVTWYNSSSRAHTVTAFDNQIPDEAEFFATGDYDSTDEAVEAWHDHTGGRLDAGDTFSHTFEVPGSYRYYCIPHLYGGMIGTVIVDG